MENGLKIQFFIKGKHYAPPPPKKKMAGGPVYFLCKNIDPQLKQYMHFFTTMRKRLTCFELLASFDLELHEYNNTSRD